MWANSCLEPNHNFYIEFAILLRAIVIVGGMAR